MKLSVAASFYVACVVTACVIPDLSEVEIARCLDTCSASYERDSKLVLEWLAGCDVDDRACQLEALRSLVDGFGAFADCAAACTRDLEETLQ